MNSLAWLGIGAPAAFWLSQFAFTTLGSTPLGVMFIALFGLSLALGIRGALYDWDQFFGRGGEPDS